MEDLGLYSVDFTKHEINSLAEVLAHYRKHFDGMSKEQKMANVVYVAAARLSHKIGLVLSPQGGVSVEDYF